jgi:hypothetical protein
MSRPSFVFSRLALGLAALATLGAGTSARAGALELCIHSCVEDYYPFHDPCVAGCILNWIVFGVSGVDDDNGVLKLAATTAGRSNVQIGAGARSSTGQSTLDPDVSTVRFEYIPLTDYLNGRTNWSAIGSGVPSSVIGGWQVSWNASTLSSGDYLVRATFYEQRESNEAFLALQVP